MTSSHAFVVPAYGQSPYLETCLASLSAQQRPSSIVIATSTPFTGLEEVCERHGARLHVHGPNQGIGHDWNEALAQADAEWVTIAHQDDVYASDFSSRVLEAIEGAGQVGFAFTDAVEINPDGSMRQGGLNQRIKRALVTAAFLGRDRIHGASSRRLLLGLGNAINCPAVTLNKRLHPLFKFREDLRTNMDWMAWVELSGNSGILRIPHALVEHRVHPDSETARCLDDGARRLEDKMVFDTLWPRPISGLLQRLYATSYQGYMP